MKILNRFGLELDKVQLNKTDLSLIRDNLSVYNQQDNTTVYYYFEDDKTIYIPKLSRNIESYVGQVVRSSTIINDSNIKYYNNEDIFASKKMLIEPRNEIQIKTMDFLLNSKSDDKSLFLSPGTGKTAMSIMYFIKKKLKPLIILPDTNLMTQWKDSILEFSNLTEDDIFVFENGANSFKSKSFSKDKLVYICCIKTPASMVSKSTIEELKQFHKNIIEECKIDLKIFDECHLNLNAIFKTTLWFPTKENLFLSGTMNRSSVKENIIHPGIVEPDEAIESTEYEVIPNLLSVWYDSKPTKKNIYYCQDMAQRGLIDYNRYFNTYLLSKKHQAKADVYFAMIENMCDYFINNDKRYDYDNKIIIVGQTIDFLDQLYLCLKDKYRVCRMYSKYKEKPEDENYDIIIGTNKMLTSGFDKKSLNVMISTFMNTSSHNIKQLIGRICRSYKNKPFAQYICLADTAFSAMHKYFEKHKNICENELSEKNALVFIGQMSKYEFPYIEEEKKKEN